MGVTREGKDGEGGREGQGETELPEYYLHKLLFSLLKWILSSHFIPVNFSEFCCSFMDYYLYIMRILSEYKFQPG